jgi:predicted TIM-barrel fold metal-dependent hydrolase
MAAMADTGRYGATRVAVGFVTSGDLTVGVDFRAVLEAHLAVAPDRFKGVRQLGLWDSDDSILGSLGEVENFYGQPRLRQGFAELAKLDLSFDALVLAPQLGDVVDLAQAFPETRIVVNHLGEPVGVGRHSGRREEEFSEWRADMAALSRCSNVAVKVGGIGSFLQGFDFVNADPPASSETLAAAWRPYAESVVELFGAERCMFESNVPADKAGPFNNVCNAYKRIFSGCSASEKRLFFAETAVRVYRLPESLLAEAGGK